MQKEEEQHFFPKKTGDEVDVLGPLGNGFPIDEVAAGQTAFLVGGGIGVPPLYELSKQLLKKGLNAIHVLDSNQKMLYFMKKNFKNLVKHIS